MWHILLSCRGGGENGSVYDGDDPDGSLNGHLFSEQNRLNTHHYRHIYSLCGARSHSSFTSTTFKDSGCHSVNLQNPKNV